MAIFLAILVIEALILVPSYRNHEENLLRQQETIARQAITAFLATKTSELKQAHVTQLMDATGLLGLQLKINGDTFIAGEPVVNPGPAEARLRDLERVNANALDLQWSQGEWLMDYPVAARLDVSGISGELWAFVLRILGLSLIIPLFVTVVTMVVLDRMMLSPLLRLRARITQASEDAEHPLDYIRPTERCDEFGEVEGTFNQMLMQSDSHLHRLSTLNAELDQLVAERTQSLRATEQELKIRTWYDQLTGLANRPLFEERLNRYLATFDARRTPWQGALVMLGLDGLVGLVASKLAEHDLPPNQLELEITETALMADVDRALTVMREFRGLGVQLAVDDFGTGYSSLAYLKQLPVSRIKIDRAFVMGLPANEQDAILCRTIVNMAHGLGCEVIAEGVETEAQAQWLIDIECDESQGFLLGRPEASPRITPIECF